MKRDPRLRGLSSEHHGALVLARTLTARVGEGRIADAVAELAARFAPELDPHFRVEEELLLPALRQAGEGELVARVEADHAFLRASAAAVAGGGERGQALLAFAERLTEHVRFEERALFPCCEARLPAAVLDAVARRSPHARGPGRT